MKIRNTLNFDVIREIVWRVNTSAYLICHFPMGYFVQEVMRGDSDETYLKYKIWVSCVDLGIFHHHRPIWPVWNIALEAMHFGEVHHISCNKLAQLVRRSLMVHGVPRSIPSRAVFLAHMKTWVSLTFPWTRK